MYALCAFSMRDGLCLHIAAWQWEDWFAENQVGKLVLTSWENIYEKDIIYVVFLLCSSGRASNIAMSAASWLGPWPGFPFSVSYLIIPFGNSFFFAPSLCRALFLPRFFCSCDDLYPVDSTLGSARLAQPALIGCCWSPRTVSTELDECLWTSGGVWMNP